MMGGATPHRQSLIVNGVSVTVVGITPPGFPACGPIRGGGCVAADRIAAGAALQNNSSSYGSLRGRQFLARQDLVAWVRSRGPRRHGEPGARDRRIRPPMTGLTALAQTFANPRNGTGIAGAHAPDGVLLAGFSGLRARILRRAVRADRHGGRRAARDLRQHREPGWRARWDARDLASDLARRQQRPSDPPVSGGEPHVGGGRRRRRRGSPDGRAAFAHQVLATSSPLPAAFRRTCGC